MNRRIGAIDQRTGRQQQSAKHQGVPVHHPLQALHAGTEIVRQRGQRDVDHDRIEGDNEKTKKGRNQRGLRAARLF